MAVKALLVRHLRHRRRMTQKELGQAIGQGQPFVSDIERGVRAVLTVATLEKLALALGVHLEELITADERRSRAQCRQDEALKRPGRE
jgi:transcriptional regulator with XRE-family HTH domain